MAIKKKKKIDQATNERMASATPTVKEASDIIIIIHFFRWPNGS